MTKESALEFTLRSTIAGFLVCATLLAACSPCQRFVSCEAAPDSSPARYDQNGCQVHPPAAGAPASAMVARESAQEPKFGPEPVIPADSRVFELSVSELKAKIVRAMPIPRRRNAGDTEGPPSIQSGIGTYPATTLGEYVGIWVGLLSSPGRGRIFPQSWMIRLVLSGKGEFQLWVASSPKVEREYYLLREGTWRSTSSGITARASTGWVVGMVGSLESQLTLPAGSLLNSRASPASSPGLQRFLSKSYSLTRRH